MLYGVGAPCDFDSQCITGLCGGTPKTCRIPVDQDCTGYRGDVCAAGTACTQTTANGTSACKLADAAACSASSQCASYYVGSNFSAFFTDACYDACAGGTPCPVCLKSAGATGCTLGGPPGMYTNGCAPGLCAYNQARASWGCVWGPCGRRHRTASPLRCRRFHAAKLGLVRCAAG